MSTPANGNGKDVLYVDVDDEITGIIDKVTSSSSKVIALVLPKRATVFQSIVNMKLLKRRADAAKKHIVLITSEAGLLPLAGNVGLYVAKTLQSKPEIPEAMALASDITDDVDEDAPVSMPAEDFDAAKESSTPVGSLAGSAKPSVAQPMDDALELDNSDLPAPSARNGKDGNIAALAAAGGSGKAAKSKKNRKLKVPNFNRFRLLIVIGILVLILLILGWFLAFRVLPAAAVTIKSKTSTVNASLSPTLDTSVTSLDPTKNLIPAQTQQQQKSNTEQAPATGKKNEGDKATGNVTLSAPCSSFASGPTITIPAGTGLSANGLTFITQNTVTLAYGYSCFNSHASISGTTSVTAQSGGSQYNMNNTSFTDSSQSDVTGTGSTSGGTDNIVTTVQQSDIDAAEAKLKNDQNADTVKQQLEQNLQNNGLYPIEATFYASKPNISPSVQAGSQASNVTVTESVTYTMYGAKKADIQKLLDDQINQQIDTSKQGIQDDGLSQNSFNAPNPGSGSTLDISIQTSATIGPHIDVANLKTQIAGKKSGDVQNTIKAIPGVTDVQVHYSPFWVSSTPSNVKKITINFEK